MKTRRRIAAVLAIVLPLVVLPTVAAQAAPADVIYGVKWYTTAHSADGYTYSAWKECAEAVASPHAQTIKCEQSNSTMVSITAKVSGTNNVGDDSLSAEVGYTVAKTTSESISDTVTFAAHQSGSISYRARFSQTKVTQEECQTLHGSCDGTILAHATAYTNKYSVIQWETS